jgi:hypothetical protein
MQSHPVEGKGEERDMFKSAWRIGFLGACCLLLSGVAAHATTINFDVDAGGSLIAAPSAFDLTVPLSNLYSSLGVTFAGPDSGGGGAILNPSTFGFPARSGQNILAFNPSAGYPNFPETINFASTVSYVEIWMSGSFDTDTVRMTAFDAANGVLGIQTLSANDWAKLSITASGIAKVTLDRIGGGGGTEFDDLTFGDSPNVPEPSTLLLLGSGLVGLAGLGWRRIRQ